jgi:hypothetical protein
VVCQLGGLSSGAQLFCNFRYLSMLVVVSFIGVFCSILFSGLFSYWPVPLLCFLLFLRFLTSYCRLRLWFVYSSMVPQSGSHSFCCTHSQSPVGSTDPATASSLRRQRPPSSRPRAVAAVGSQRPHAPAVHICGWCHTSQTTGVKLVSL